MADTPTNQIRKNKKIISLFERIKTLLGKGKPQQALFLSEKGIEQLPDRLAFYRCKARALLALNRNEEVVDTLLAVKHLLSEDAMAYVELGDAYAALDKHEQALECYLEALRANIRLPSLYITIGNAYRLKREYGEAIAYYRQGLAMVRANDPNRSVALMNLGVALTETAQYDEGLTVLQETIREDPNNAMACYNAFMAAKHKDLPYEAAQLYELAFFNGIRVPFRQFPNMQRWNGEDISDKRLLIWREQGIGDEIYYSQLYHWAIGRAAHVKIEATPRLIPLFQRSFPQAEVVPEDAKNDLSREDADYHIPAASLPLACGSSEAARAQMNHPAGWLTPDPDRVAFWKERLSALPGLKVGISWRSRTMSKERRWYYFTLEQATPLLKTEGVSWINQQYHDAKEEIAEFEKKTGIHIHDWDDIDLMNDLDDVTAFMRALDLLITAGTSPMFLAKCVGTPTWTLYPAAPQPFMGPVKAIWDHEPGGQTFFRHWQEEWDLVLVRVAGELKKLVKQTEAEGKALVRRAAGT